MASIPNSEIIEGSWPDVSEDAWDDLPALFSHWPQRERVIKRERDFD